MFTETVTLSIVGLFCSEICFVLITLFSSFQTIKSGQVGLKVRFGKIVDTKLDEGLNLKIPYIEKIVTVNIKVQKVEITTQSSSAFHFTTQAKHRQRMSLFKSNMLFALTRKTPSF